MLRATKICFVQHQNEEEVLQGKNTDLPAIEGRGQGYAFHVFRRKVQQLVALFGWRNPILDWVLYVIVGKQFHFKCLKDHCAKVI